MKSILSWQVGYCNTADSRPEQYFPATVPGAVQLDYARRFNLPDYAFEQQFEQYQWMHDKFWVYRTEVDLTDCTDAKSVYLIAKGIDYQYEILVNGTKVYAYEGAYKPVECPLSAYIGEKCALEIVIYPAPKSQLPGVHPNSRDEANQCCKPPVSYGWDFHPRLIPLGIWDDIYLEVSNHAATIKPTVSYVLSEDYQSATVRLSVECDTPLHWLVTDPHGNPVFSGNNAFETFEIKNPLLWWCNGYGDPNLYLWQLEIPNGKLTEQFSGKIGFKSITLEMNEGTWSELGPIFPKTRSCPPITVCLNGVKLFMKGTNWVAPEIFYGTINRNRYKEQLELIANANLNIIRCWGGAIVNKDCFFDICDELGLLVWQEFPLACNNYKATDAYMALLRSEATAIIERLKGHACLAVWCGGNELFNAWSGMTDQSHAIRLLNKITLEETPEIPFLPSSPVMGMAHGSYSFKYFDGREVFQVMPVAHHTAYTEFGIPGLSNLDCLRRLTTPDKLFPMENNELTRAHHAYKVWAFRDSWSGTDVIHSYFGDSDSLEQLIYRGQLMQSEGYKCIFEEARRQKPYCSFAVNWCFNEPWPCIANNSLVCYPNSPKPAYYAVAASCRSVLASARLRKFSYDDGEPLEFDLWLLNDSLQPVEDGAVEVYLEIGETKKRLLRWEYTDVALNTNLQGPTVHTVLPEVPGVELLKLELQCGEYSSTYVLRYNYREKVDTANKPKMLNVD